MPTLKSIEVLGYDRAFLGLPASEPGEEPFTYYSFDTYHSQQWVEHFPLIGVRQREEKVKLLDIRVFHIVEELLSDHFEAVRSAGSFISFNPAELVALIQFFESYVQSDQIMLPDSHFRVLTSDELEELHVESWRYDTSKGGGSGSYYHYVPDNDVQSDQLITLLCVPHWNVEYGSNQNGSLDLATFKRQELNDSHFRPFTGGWRGYATFNQAAWQEFLALLQQRTYEQFLHKHGQ